MRTLKFKAQLKNAFFTTVNQMFGCSSPLSNIAEYCFVDRTVLNETVLGSSRKPGGAAEHLIDGSERRICRLSFDGVRVLLKGAVIPQISLRKRLSPWSSLSLGFLLFYP